MKKFDFDFYKNRKILFGISIGLMVIGLIFNFIRCTKMDIQFVGGAMIKYSVDGEVDTDEIASLVKEETGRDVSVALSKTFGTDANQVTLSFAGNEAVTLDEQQAIAQSLSDAYADRTFNVVESSSVDPTMGAKFFQKCLVCLLITFVILLVYIALRFKKIGGLSAGVTALIALVHDVLLVYFAFVIFGFSINDIFIAVILTILGYSLNDTIVIYDRIRENRKLSPTKSPDALPAIVNKSLNQTMTRSILTSLTTFMALLVIHIVAAVYGISSVQSFALPMMVGTIVGCYSSLCIAAPLYTMWAVIRARRARSNLTRAAFKQAFLLQNEIPGKPCALREFLYRTHFAVQGIEINKR